MLNSILLANLPCVFPLKTGEQLRRMEHSRTVCPGLGRQPAREKLPLKPVAHLMIASYVLLNPIAASGWTYLPDHIGTL